MRKAHGCVLFDYQDQSGNWKPRATPPEPPWLRRLLGGDMFVNVEGVKFDADLEFSDAGLEHLEGLAQLRNAGAQPTPWSAMPDWNTSKDWPSSEGLA